MVIRLCMTAISILRLFILKKTLSCIAAGQWNYTSHIRFYSVRNILQEGEASMMPYRGHSF